MICVTFESLQRSTECLFPPIKKTVAMVCFLSLQSTHKDSILHYKPVTAIIKAFNFAEVLLDIVVYCQNLPDLLLPIKIFSDVVICHRGFLDSVVTNKSFLFLS